MWKCTKSGYEEIVLKCPSANLCDSVNHRCNSVNPTTLPTSCKYDCITASQCISEGGKTTSGTCSRSKVCCKINNDPPPPPDDPDTPDCDYDCVSRTMCNTYGDERAGSCGASSNKVCCDL